MFLVIRVIAHARLSRPRRAPTRYHPMEQSEHDALTAPRKEWATGPPVGARSADSFIPGE